MNKDNIILTVICVSCIVLGFLVGMMYGAYSQMDYTSNELYTIAKSNNTLFRDTNYNLYSITLYEPFDYTKNIRINQSNTS